MPNQLEDEVVQNNQNLGREAARNRIPTPNAQSTIATTATVSVDATITIYTRPLNDSLVLGNPDEATHGLGRGKLGDQRGSWTQQDQVSTTLDRDGQRAIAEALSGSDTTIAEATVGDELVNAWQIDDSDTETRARSSFRFSESPDSVTSPELRDNQGRTVASASLSGVSADENTEVRCDVSLAFSDNSGTNAAVTDLATVTDALDDAGDTRIGGIALGTDDTTPSQSDSSLGTEVLRKPGDRSAVGSSAVVEIVAIREEPTSQPHDIVELGILNQSQNLVSRLTFSAETKDDRIRLRARGAIDIE
ncbi:hypothetical protein OSG_eHP14_00165 [environmental Halophage eHP-14]|nr:hypothetical protein OSG_eHP14_00165 [environmental Halophage eHP-14]